MLRYTNPNTWTFPGGWQYNPPQQQAPAVLPANSTQPGAPPGEVVPFDAALTAQLNGADLNYGNTLAALAAQEPIIQRSFGYQDDGSIDPNNPFSRAQLLQRAYQQTQRGTGNRYAARGQLYSGALQRAQSDNQFNYQAQDAMLRGSYAQQLAELAGLQADAANTRNNQRSDAYENWVMSQVANRNAPPVDPSPAPAGGPSPEEPLGPASPMPPQQSFASLQGTPVEQYLRAVYAASQGAGSAGGLVGRLFARR
ncbi:hypothetical protein [Capillimicrobium parvum]|uniref:hypothetical protein n=1 Tax=Capillimicrobium parvum TaxID=2884022 RepID=UPI00216ACE8B|nr:hypothetical protein [Capillimicrobium parvum]